MLVRAYAADESTLRAMLTSKNSAERLTAAYIVGERQLPWTNDLIDRLTDTNDLVRQAARRSLVILSYFALQREEPSASATETCPDCQSGIVDFGPKPAADKTAREESAKKWDDWWTRHGGSLRSSQSQLAASAEAQVDAEAARLSAALVFAPADKQADGLARYSKKKGVVYTEAIADALPQLDGDMRRTARQSLVERLSRMTAATLRERLQDPRPELRRAAALAWATKDDQAAIPQLIPLLADPDDFVVRGAKAALKSLTGQDLGPPRDATPAGRDAAIAAWKAWWQKQPKS